MIFYCLFLKHKQSEVRVKCDLSLGYEISLILIEGGDGCMGSGKNGVALGLEAKELGFI